MKIDEAIKYLKTDKSGVVCNEQARQLGIEALKRIKEYRRYKDFAHTTDLPSETEA